VILTSSGNVVPVHPREPRVSTCTNDPESAFTYADLHGRLDTPLLWTSRGAQAQDADQEDRVVYVRARAGKNDKKKTTRRGGDSGGYDSGGGSDDFAQGRRKGYDSDESDGAQKRKKEKLTRDYLETGRKTPLLAFPRELMAAFARTPGMGRIPVHPIYS